MTSLRRRRSLAWLAATAAGPAAWSPVWAAPAAPGEGVAWPRVRLLEGQDWGPAQASGKAVVVVFWSITCAYCVRHNAHVEKLHQATQGQALEIITVVRENDAPAAQRHLARHGWHFAVTLDHAPMANALSLRRLSPLTITIDRQGRLKQVIPGEMSEDDVMQLQRIG